MLANRGCQIPLMCLTHRVRQQAGSYSNLRNNPKITGKRCTPQQPEIAGNAVIYAKTKITGKRSNPGNNSKTQQL